MEARELKKEIENTEVEALRVRIKDLVEKEEILKEENMKIMEGLEKAKEKNKILEDENKRLSENCRIVTEEYRKTILKLSEENTKLHGEIKAYRRILKV